jgi:hypothetical protein
MSRIEDASKFFEKLNLDCHFTDNPAIFTKKHCSQKCDINEDQCLRSHKKYTHQVKLDVIAVISNPVKFERRYELFREFCERVRNEPQVRLTTVELQQGSRPFATNSTLKFRTHHEIWYKENLINIGISNLPYDWEYVAWIDADIEFQNKNWVRDTIEQLQTYDVIQLFTHAIDLGPNGETLQVHTGFMYSYINEGCSWKKDKYAGYRHSGYAWAATRRAINNMGTLLEFAIFGSADYHMAVGFIGEMDKSLRGDLHPNYIKLCKLFEERCERHIKRNVGYLDGTILHNWHSCKSRRRYHDRPKTLANLQFDPLRDLKKDWEGLWQLEDINIKLRDEIRYYFRSRHEDSKDLHQDYKYVKKDWL